MSRRKERGTRRKFSRVRFGHRPTKRAGAPASADPSMISRAGRGHPIRKPSVKPEATERREQCNLRAAAHSRVVCARAAPDRVFLLLTPSHFFPAVGNSGALGSWAVQSLTPS